MKLTPKYITSQFVFAIIRVMNIPFYYLSKWLGLGYQVFIPGSTYAPWLKDEAFLRVFNKAKKNSLLNFYQGYELWKMAEQADKIDGDVLEVGVWRGSSSIVMASKLKQIGSTKRIYACDTFEGVVKSDSEHDNYYQDGEHKDTSLEFVDNLMKNSFQLENVTLLKGIFPDDTQHLISDHSFSLCHIDVDTYSSAKEVMNWVWGRLNVGGVIVFNDYGFPMTQGITKLVNDYRSDTDKVVIHNLNGHGIIVKVESR